MKKNKLLLITLLLMMNGTIACKNKTEKPEIRVAEVTHSIFYAPQYVSKNLGYFADEGIEVTFITTPGADKTTAALLSKDVDIGLMGPEASIYIEKNNA